MKHYILKTALILFLISSKFLSATEVIEFKNQDGDMTLKVREAIEKSKDKDIKLIFEKGVYSFRSDYALGKFLYITNHGNGFKKIAFNFSGFNSVEIDGQGSEFLFHGTIAPFVFEDCQKIKVTNLTVDWDIPFVFQADVLAINKEEGYMDVKPYTEGFSWNLSKGRIIFPGIDNFEYNSLGSTLPHNKKTKAVDYGAWDMHLNPEYVEKLPKGNLRIHQKHMKHLPRVGTVLNSKGDREKDRYAPAFLARRSNHINFDNVIIHHALGMGFLFERCEDINIVNSGVYIRDGSDRVISSTADATHFANCKGNVLIENCRIEGMYDDGTNVRGTYVEVIKVINEKTVQVALKHFEQMGFQFADKGDAVWFIQQPNPQRALEGIVESVYVINEKFREITFTENVPSNLKAGDILENKTWNPVFTMRGNVIRDHRARNIIIKTPKRIVIEDNDLSSMMSSIMLRGETFFWFESGNVEDVIIRNNRFEHCAYGGPEHAVLKVSPRLGKTFDQTMPYDRNIVFENNTIKTFDNRIVWADRVDGLIIRNNTIKQTDTEKQQFPDAPLFDLEHCMNVEIMNNTYDGNCENSLKADAVSMKTLKIKKNKGFKNLK
ncbi:alpha-1,3-galactosidase-related protein [Algibacter mikhailovii]|uniref:Alpha-1,3-galactosidase B n=1 Tax=Algibacter mikhailovii TaxID=425498 RepID=A0A918R8N7_9FLAO|nr:right-handed parallel beta-helix repeat-containing protein [Algibacter mikhailovii]GGZ87948.1 alpha-1,3-galactosidase B [Algibacter mikhailovii]